jgi:CheY-like chemotaxis protein
MTGAGGATAAGPSRGGHILIVDDNAINRMLLTRGLQEQGHFVTTADHGRQGLELLRAHGTLFDVVLLDIVMPELDGFETLRQLKDDPHLAQIPVVMISSVDEMDSVMRCIRMGAADYIPKPFNVGLLRALTNRINALLEAKRARQRELEFAAVAERLADVVAAMAGARHETTTTASNAPGLSEIAARDDALGRLARAVQRLGRATA